MLKLIKYGIFIFLALFLIGLLGADDKTNNDVKKVEKTEKSFDDYVSYKIGYIEKSATWADDYSDMPKLADALRREDEDYLKELIREGKVHIINKNTTVEISDTPNEGIVNIYFKEGKYTGKWGYTFKSFARYDEIRTN